MNDELLPVPQGEIVAIIKTKFIDDGDWSPLPFPESD